MCKHLISTSVEDCRISLEGELRSDPVACLKDCVAVIEETRRMPRQSSRLKVAITVARKALKAIADVPF